MRSLPLATAVPPRARPARPLRVAVLGNGAIGAPVVRALRNAEVPGAVFAGLIDTHGIHDRSGDPIDLATLVERTDLVVEAAGQRALTETGPRLVAAGLDLLALSVGALADDAVHEALAQGPGRLYLSTGAIAGLDLLRALADAGDPPTVTIASSKLPTTLVQDWMDAAERDRLIHATARVEVMRGTPQEIATAFPRSANVAMAVFAAAGPTAAVEAVMYADPACTVTTHEIGVEAATGSYAFRISNYPSPDNPATSGLVPLAVLRALRDLAGVRAETLI